MPRIYRSYEEFERDELRNIDKLHSTIDEMLDHAFAEELDFEFGGRRKREDDEE